MESQYSEFNIEQTLLTLEDMSDAIAQLLEWNENVKSTDDYNCSPQGMQLLAANCMLITAIGEGINRCNRFLPDFLSSNFPEIPWRSIIGMRNHIAHGYFELDADIVFSAIKNNVPDLNKSITKAIDLLKRTGD